jgi:hypothetical protein
MAYLAQLLPSPRWGGLTVPTSNVQERLDNPGDRSDAPLLADSELTTELAWLVERVQRNNLPWIVVSGSALTAWQERDPAGWAKVSGWLAARQVTIVRI